MATPFLGQISMISWNFPPKGWAFCNGQLLPINQNQALFSILGTTYGGDGRVTFALPDLRSRVPLHTGNGFVLGQRGGEVTHTLSTPELPSHGHPVKASSSAADTANPVGSFLANSGNTNFIPAASANTTLTPATVGADGGSQPHENESPFLAINFIIALQGIFPSQN